MSVEITKVQNRAELKKFIRFNYELYKDNPYSVPDLLEDMLDTYNPKKNPAFEFCEADYYLAWRDGKIVGRVACIINHKANPIRETINFSDFEKLDIRVGTVTACERVPKMKKLLRFEIADGL